jgi:hypothetical protein
MLYVVYFYNVRRYTISMSFDSLALRCSSACQYDIDGNRSLKIGQRCILQSKGCLREVPYKL